MCNCSYITSSFEHSLVLSILCVTEILSGHVCHLFPMKAVKCYCLQRPTAFSLLPFPLAAIGND